MTLRGTSAQGALAPGHAVPRPMHQQVMQMHLPPLLIPCTYSDTAWQAVTISHVAENGVRLQADMQPVQLRAVPSSAGDPGRICLVPKRATRRVALRFSVQAAEELKHAGVLPVDSGLGSTASSSSAEVRGFLQTCVSMHA